MKRPSISLLLGCLLVGAACVLVATHNNNTHGDDRKPSPIRTRHPRSTSGVSSAQLLAATRQHSPASRGAWARSLDDAELKRLTREFIAAYQNEANSKNDVASWLVPLAKEWGRRDIDGFLVEIKSNPFLINVRSAGLIGCSETDPQKAFLLLIQPRETDFVIIDTSKGVVAEAIFRNWASQDPARAWHELLSVSATWSFYNGIRGLIAGNSDPEIQKEILQWIVERKRQANDVDPFANDAVVDRNNIDAILNNPNRFDSNSLIFSAALGLVEHDPEKAWEWLTSQPPAGFGDITLNGELHSSSGSFLAQWAERQPSQVIAFINQHLDSITAGQRLASARSLFSREPEAALDMLAAIPDPAWRESEVSRFFLVNNVSDSAEVPYWPLVESIHAPLPANEFTQRIMAGLDRLALPESETASLRLTLEQQTTAQAEAPPP